jgi:WD40 repeat protein
MLNFNRFLLLAQSLSGHTSSVEAVEFDTAEVLVLAGSSNGSIKLWDLEEAKGMVGAYTMPKKRLSID